MQFVARPLLPETTDSGCLTVRTEHPLILPKPFLKRGKTVSPSPATRISSCNLWGSHLASAGSLLSKLPGTHPITLALVSRPLLFPLKKHNGWPVS
jgi:hypothetical protein